MSIHSIHQSFIPFSADVNIVPKQFRSTTSHSCNGGVSDIASNHIEHSSPVSLEVYVPSAAGKYDCISYSI